MSTERPNYQVKDTQHAPRVVPPHEKRWLHEPYGGGILPNPFLIDALIWEVQRRDRQNINEGGE